MIHGEEWFVLATHARVEDALGQLRVAMDAHDEERIRIVAEAVRLSAGIPAVMACSSAERRTAALDELRRAVDRLRGELREAYRRFVRRRYRRLLPGADDMARCGETLQKLRVTLVRRYEGTTEPDTGRCWEMLDSLLDRCRSEAASVGKGGDRG